MRCGQARHGLNPVGRVIVFLQLAQSEVGAIVHGDVDRRSRIVLHVNLFEVRHETHFLQSLFVILHVFVGLGRALVIVEGNTRRDHVEHHRAVVRDGGLQHGTQLSLVAGEGAANKRCTQLNGQRAGVNRRQIVQHAGLQLRPQIGGGRELALGQAINAVVLDDVDDGKIAAHEVNKLSDADRSRIAVAAHAQRN